MKKILRYVGTILGVMILAYFAGYLYFIFTTV